MIVDVDRSPVDSVVDISPLELICLARAGELDQGGPLGDGDLLHAPRVLHGKVLQLLVQLLAGEVLGHARQVGHLHCVNTLYNKVVQKYLFCKVVSKKDFKKVL